MKHAYVALLTFSASPLGLAAGLVWASGIRGLVLPILGWILALWIGGFFFGAAVMIRRIAHRKVIEEMKELEKLEVPEFSVPELKIGIGRMNVDASLRVAVEVSARGHGSVCSLCIPAPVARAYADALYRAAADLDAMLADKPKEILS